MTAAPSTRPRWAPLGQHPPLLGAAWAGWRAGRVAVMLSSPLPTPSGVTEVAVGRALAKVTSHGVRASGPGVPKLSSN